jgi:hypothetical protein
MIRSHFNMVTAHRYHSGSQTSNGELLIRPAAAQDEHGLWRVIEPMIRAGETYPLARDLTRADAMAYWHSPQHEVFVAEREGVIVGTYYLRANTRGGGAHVANCGYVVAPRAMCAHSMERARARGFRAM